MKADEKEKEDYRVSKKIKTFNKSLENDSNYQEKYTKKKKMKHKEVIKQQFAPLIYNDLDKSNQHKKKKKKNRQDPRDDNSVDKIIQDQTNQFNVSKKSKKRDKQENPDNFDSMEDVFNSDKSIKHVIAAASNQNRKKGKRAYNEEMLVPKVIQDGSHQFRDSKELKKYFKENKKLTIQNVDGTFSTDLLHDPRHNKTIEKIIGSTSDQTMCLDVLIKAKAIDVRGNELKLRTDPIHDNSRVSAKENIKIKRITLADDLLKESIKKFNKKRKRTSESTDYRTSPTAEILHRSKKVKSNPNKEVSGLSDFLNEDPSIASGNKCRKTIRKIKEANDSFEDRLNSESPKMDLEEENVNGLTGDTPDSDCSLEDLFHKLIKSRTKSFNEKCRKSENDHKQNLETKVHKISTEIEETFSTKCKNNEDIQANKKKAVTNVIITKVDNKDKAEKTKKMRENNATSSNNHNAIEHEDTSKNMEDAFEEEKNLDDVVKQKSYSHKDDGDEESDYVNGIKLSTVHFESLEGLVVTLPFTPHLVHMIETKLTNRPNLSQREQMRELGYEVISKLYNKQEDRTIISNWKEFCESHSLADDPAPFLVPNKYLSHKEKKKFVQYLANGLPHRSLASVYKRFRLLFTTHLKKGKFSKEEDEIIFECIAEVELEGFTKKSARVFAILSKVLQRDRLQIQKHYETVCKERNAQYIYKDCDKLIKTLQSVLGKENANDLANCEITLSDWKKIEKLLDHPYNLLKTFWLNTLYPKLFYHGDRECFSIRKDITRILQGEKTSDWKVLDWEEISKNFKGHTSEAIYKSYKQFVYSTVPKSKWDDLVACTTYLTQNYFNKTPKQRRFLKQISKDDSGVFKIRKHKVSKSS